MNLEDSNLIKNINNVKSNDILLYKLSYFILFLRLICTD